MLFASGLDPLSAIRDCQHNQAGTEAAPNTRGKLMEVAELNGAGDRDRTGDIQLGKLAFYR
jgi:hypothetical protein